MLTVLQIDLLLSAFAALLPLVPDKHRARAAEIIQAASDVTRAATAISGGIDALAQKLSALRDDVAAMGERAVTASELDQAVQRVREASAAFRAAYETAAAQPT
jgi:hypothetical protein